MNNTTGSIVYQYIMQVPYAFRAVFTTVLFAVALVSVTGNILEIITFLKTQNLRTSTNYYITSMAISDLFFSVSNYLVFAKSRLSVFKHSLSPFACKFGDYISSISYSVSIASLVLISVDRFVATVFPMKVTMITARIRSVFILLTWVIPMGIFYPWFQFTRNASELERPYICIFDTSGRLAEIIYFTISFVLLYFVPLVIITILNYRIMKSLRRTNPVIQENSHNGTARRRRNQRMTKMLTFINVFFFICWTLTYVIVFLRNQFSKHFKMYILEIFNFFCFFFLPGVSTVLRVVSVLL